MTSHDKTISSYAQGLLSETIDEAASKIEAWVYTLVQSQFKQRLSGTLQSSEEVDELQSNLFLHWKRVSSSEYPTFSIAMGSETDILSLLQMIFPSLQPSSQLLKPFFQDKWLQWDSPKGNLYLLDYRSEPDVDLQHDDTINDENISSNDLHKEKDIVSTINNTVHRLPSHFKHIDLEIYLIQNEEDVISFCEIVTHGLGEVKHEYRQGSLVADKVIVFIQNELQDTLCDKVKEKCQKDGWLFVDTPLKSISHEHLVEQIGLLLPKEKLGGFARLSGSRRLQQAEAYEVIRFSVLLSSAAGTFVLPTAVASFMTTIHSYMLLRMAWLSGRSVEPRVMTEALKVIGRSVTVGYGLRALLGTASSGIPMVGKFLAGLMFASVTEDLGEEARGYYVGEP